MIRFLFVISLLGVSNAHALRHTTSDAQLSPDHAGFRPKNVVLIVDNLPPATQEVLESVLTKAFKRERIHAETGSEMFTDNVSWTGQARLARMAEQGIDTILFVAGAANAEVVVPDVMAHFPAGELVSYAEDPRFARRATTYNLEGTRTLTRISAVLYSIERLAVVWHSDMLIKAGGLKYSTAEGYGKSAGTKVLKDLEADAVIPR